MAQITQSLMKSLFDYTEGNECGLLFHAKYIEGRDFPPTEAQALGQWFEYICTGALTKYGHTPQPVKIKSGELSAPYRRMELQKKNFDKIIAHYKIKILDKSKTLVFGNTEGTLDLEVEMFGKEAYIDIKTTGHIDNKWEEYGWHTESLENKEKIMTQAVHYKWLGKKITGKDIPFYFMVFSTTNEFDCKFIKTNIDPDRMAFHQRVIAGADKLLKEHLDAGFKALPSLKRCNDCPLNATCQSKTEVPMIEEVNY